VKAESIKEQLWYSQRAARIAEIEGMEAKLYMPKWITESKTEFKIMRKAAKDIIGKFKEVQKNFTTDLIIPEDITKMSRQGNIKVDDIRDIILNVKFIKDTAGKFKGQFNAIKPNLLNDLREIFDNSIYAYSSNYKDIRQRADGSFHRDKPNVVMYHHFINKIQAGTNIYYIRFTVEELKTYGQLHSVHISEARIANKKSRNVSRTLPGKHRGETTASAYDPNITYFFNSVKEKQEK